MSSAPNAAPAGTAPLDDLVVLRRQLAERDEQLRQVLHQRGEQLFAEVESLRAREHAEAQLRSLDPVTHLFRHACIRQRLQFEWERSARTGEPLGIALLDLDGFDAFNAKFGYRVGDEALARVGRALQSDTLASRLPRPPQLGRESADSVLVLGPSADLDTFRAYAEDLRALVERLPLPQGRLTASVGVVHVPSVTSSLDEAKPLALARTAVDRARRDGGNRIVSSIEEGGGHG